MRIFVAIAVNLFLCGIVAVPAQNDVTKSFQVAMHHQDLQSILSAIEERLRNLDNIYSVHLSPTFEDKLKQYQRKLESIDAKIIRLESVAMLNLDKISENISTKNLKDDVAKTILVKKVDAIYEGISHKLNNIERKSDSNSHRIQGKLDSIISRLEKMDESFNRHNEDIQIELSDAMATIDDLNARYGILEENIVNNTNENFEIHLQEQVQIMQSYNDKSQEAIKILQDNATKQFHKITEGIRTGINTVNETERFVREFKSELKTDLNDYAVKVADMNSENWKTGNALQDKQKFFEIILQSTKSDLQNIFKTMMTQITKMSTAEAPSSGQAQIDKLNEKIDTNFQKVFSAQTFFMDNCYRVQMEESQIEKKISEILENLIETFDKKSAIENKDLRNLEKLFKKHDGHITRTLQQANANIVTIYENMSKKHEQLETSMEQIFGQLQSLISSVQIIETESWSNGIKEVESKIASVFKHSDNITQIVQKLKAHVEGVKEHISNNLNREYFHNITIILKEMEARYLDYYVNHTKIDHVYKHFAQGLQQMINSISTNVSKIGQQPKISREKQINRTISEIFGSDVQEAPDVELDIWDIVDVRSNLEDSANHSNIENDINMNLKKQQTLKPTVS